MAPSSCGEHLMKNLPWEFTESDGSTPERPRMQDYALIRSSSRPSGEIELGRSRRSFQKSPQVRAGRPCPDGAVACEAPKYKHPGPKRSQPTC
jgi:hypothetical protein